MTWEEISNPTDGYIAQGGTITAPTAMFLKAYDELFEKFERKVLSKIHGISASGQQHGSVFWKSGSFEKLSNLDGSKTLLEQLENSFSKKNSPIWMDSSTTDICKDLQSSLGGAQTLSDLTGSSAYERFTIHQIIKFAKENPQNWAETDRVQLISNFSVSLLAGLFAPIDYSDGSGKASLFYPNTVGS